MSLEQNYTAMFRGALQVIRVSKIKGLGPSVTLRSVLKHDYRYENWYRFLLRYTF